MQSEGEVESAQVDPEASEAEASTPAEPPRRRAARLLQLDIPSAEAGSHWLILPYDVRSQPGAEAKYPLPAEYSVQARIAAIPLRTSERSAGSTYIRRCKRAVSKYNARLKGSKVQARLAEVDETARRTAKLADMTVVNMEAELDRVRLVASATLTSMGDLNSLAKSVARQVMEAWTTGQPVHGESVTAKEALDAMGKVLTHVAKLGSAVLDESGKAQAEDAVMAEFVAATREKLAKEAEEGPNGTH